MNRSAAAEEASRFPPSCLDQFSYKVLPLEADAFDGGVTFALACRQCDNRSFRIYSHPKQAPDPSPYVGIGPGETVLMPPHRLVCDACQAGAPLFDVRSQGYDAVLNGVSSYESGEGEDLPSPGTFTVAVSFIYNIDLDELGELAAEAGVRPADLFDSIQIIGSPSATGQPFEVGYECA